ncbi:helix-turn-helix domain-containing protein [Alkalibaculum sp. M08DMB]|uniref:Helix-turn-helix domain-containing protein n=1 Tax=Alkalibaculum sporogenes TaxID=2655001 RepID=A0A6A7KAE5_9FIRM|nr:AraC family transcriptional regulator [Alkalibaculum sporogenes]MPW26478.1 helix-turn-helix domain-containing protein [Alkalibaculum sporogenes]
MISCLEDKVFYGNNVVVIKREEDYEVYRMEDESGEGYMTCYHVLPGIDLIYNDFHMENCISQLRPNVEMIGIDHCREGRIEWEFENDSYMYLQEGDFQINSREHHAIGFGFPLRHYHGITIAIYLEEASGILSTILDGFSIDLQALRTKLCSGKTPFIIRGEDSIEHIFSELYTVSDKIRMNYFKIKVLELLLFLSVIDVPSTCIEKLYFSKAQVDTLKAIMKYMRDHLEHHFTLEELSCKFKIPLTSMKTCFKCIYGTSIYAYMRAYRMQKAALLLRETNDNIMTIAGKMGYDNSSKFAKAFKDVMGVPPFQYRKVSV